MKIKLLVMFFLISVIILSCTKQEEEKKVNEDYKNQDQLFEKQQEERVNTQTNENKLAPCPSETATNCDKSDLLNKGKSSRKYHPRGCVGEGAVNFTSPPRRIEDIEIIQPMGLMIGGHVTPIDHQYYYSKNWKPEITLEDLKDVLAPADGVILSIQIMPEYFSTKNKDLEDYRLILYHTCTFYSIYIHIYKLSPKIKEILGEIPYGENKEVKIPVKAGEVIGRSTAFDFSVHDEETMLKGFIVPEHYEGEVWKIHTVDPFDYFVEPLRSQLLEKNTRSAEPLGGKIDYDVDGKLIGNWFQENTNGYRGKNGPGPNYWTGHFALAPDAIDPEHSIISFGNFKGEAKQFGIKTNSPNPSEVGSESGLIKYELVAYNYKEPSGKFWDHTKFVKNLKAENNNEVYGTVVLQLIEKRKLKLELFPDKKASEVQGFTDKALVYER